ncbi:MAG: chorismate lyase [Gammaproteobacteria bacterium]|jgi:chorismate--pyruvate lyase
MRVVLAQVASPPVFSLLIEAVGINVISHYQREPVWRPKRQLYNINLAPSLANWLFDPASLTERIIEACDGRFSVRVLRQGWTFPMLNEARTLKMRRGSYALVRQVHLLCNDQPWVFARTVIPPKTLRGKQRRLARLGQKPLGALLFADKSMQRTEMEIARIQPGQQMYQLATYHQAQQQQPIWGRRSVFYLNHRPLLVSEIFLPTVGEPVHRSLGSINNIL